MPSEKNVTSVERAMEILNYFTIETPTLGITELSIKLQVSKSTVHRLISSMQSQGFLEQEDDTKRYKLGHNVLRLARVFLKNINLHSIAHPYLKNLRDQTGETATLNILSNNFRVCIEKAESPQDVRRFIEIGQPFPLYAGATGKVILAFQSDSIIDEILQQNKPVPLTDKTIIDAKEILKDLKIIREKGYCITSGDRINGATSISVPIRNQNNKVLASISVSGPTIRFTPEKTEKYLILIKKAAEEISNQLGYQQ